MMMFWMAIGLASSLTLGDDPQGPVLKNLTIEGEDRVSIEFARPGIELDLAPRSAPGLDWDCTWETVDFFPTVTALSALERPATLARPWLQGFAAGEVVVFRPAAERAERWELEIVDSRGRAAVSFQGEGRLPGTLVWDGRRADGSAAWAGLTYSTVLRTWDRAGNLRTLAGEAFALPPYRLDDASGLELVLAGDEPIGAAEPLTLEAASWINQVPVDGEIVVTATARSAVQAHDLTRRLAESLAGRVVGDPARIRRRTLVVPDAPDAGTVSIAVRR